MIDAFGIRAAARGRNALAGTAVALMLLAVSPAWSQQDPVVAKVNGGEVKQMGTAQEVRARHILVATENEAKQLLAEIKKGTDFAELAKLKSKDPAAAAEGGDLGYFSKEQMVPEFSEVAFKLEKGQLSEP